MAYIKVEARIRAGSSSRASKRDHTTYSNALASDASQSVYTIAEPVTNSQAPHDRLTTTGSEC